MFLHCAIHGDFAPWNMLRAPDRQILIDWEHFEPCAPCFSDPAHFMLSVYLRGHKSSADECTTALRNLSATLKTAPEDVALSLAFLAGSGRWPADFLRDVAGNILGDR